MHSRALLSQWRGRRDAAAFRELVARYAPMVFATSRRIPRDDAEAEDFAQECFEMLAAGPNEANRHVEDRWLRW